MNQRADFQYNNKKKGNEHSETADMTPTIITAGS